MVESYTLSFSNTGSAYSRDRLRPGTPLGGHVILRFREAEKILFEPEGEGLAKSLLNDTHVSQVRIRREAGGRPLA